MNFILKWRFSDFNHPSPTGWTLTKRNGMLHEWEADASAEEIFKRTPWAEAPAGRRLGLLVADFGISAFDVRPGAAFARLPSNRWTKMSRSVWPRLLDWTHGPFARFCCFKKSIGPARLHKWMRRWPFFAPKWNDWSMKLAWRTRSVSDTSGFHPKLVTWDDFVQVLPLNFFLLNLNIKFNWIYLTETLLYSNSAVLDDVLNLFNFVTPTQFAVLDFLYLGQHLSLST